MKSKTQDVPFEKLIDQLPDHYNIADRELIERAYRVAEEAHRNQKRAAGEPYITHVRVASIWLIYVPPEVVVVHTYGGRYTSQLMTYARR
jgi:(p)ppGpp synthase/HD superfamily hydrolase